MPEDMILLCLEQVLRGLHFAHSRDVLHSDMKPENVLLTTKGGQLAFKIADLGVSKVLASARGQDMKMDAGTLYYMPPEHFRGEQIDFTADIWALGCIIREMLTGKKVLEE